MKAFLFLFLIVTVRKPSKYSIKKSGLNTQVEPTNLQIYFLGIQIRPLLKSHFLTEKAAADHH